MTKKKPYYPNNWEALKGAPSEWFDSLDYEEFMDWKVSGWELPSSHECIIREENLFTGKITEHVYKRPHAAKQMLTKAMDRAESSFTVCNADAIHFLTPKKRNEQNA